MTKKITPNKHLLALIGLFVIQAVWAQDSNDESPSRETNIICFAAKKQWVCAPADEQHKAQEKAKKLALEPDQSELIDNDVEIQTLQPVNIGLQARESNPNVAIPYNIQDFTAREENSAENESTAQQQPAETKETTQPTEQAFTESTAVSTVEPTEVRETNDTTASADQSTSDVPLFQTAPNDFAYWQSHFADQWTFQVVGTSNRHHLDDFVAKNDLQHHSYAIVRTQRDDADWWIVLVGLYSSKDEAKSQQDTLPATLSNGAWVRQISTIDGFLD